MKTHAIALTISILVTSALHGQDFPSGVVRNTCTKCCASQSCDACQGNVPQVSKWQSPFRFTGWKFGKKKAPVDSTTVLTPPVFIPPPTPVVQQSPHCQRLQPRRILLVTTFDKQDRLREQQTFVQALSVQLQSRGQFDTVVAPKPVCRDGQPHFSGTFSEAEILKLARTHNADSILFCDLRMLSGYEPMAVHPALSLINVNESIALLAVSSHLDLGNPLTHTDYANYVTAHCRDDRTALYDHAPMLFIEFTAFRLADAVTGVWR